MADNKCAACGVCCCRFEVDLDRFEVEYYERKPEWQGHIRRHRDGWAYIVQVKDGRCPHLRGEIGKDIHCAIYDDRPRTCQAFAFDGPECKKLRSTVR